MTTVNLCETCSKAKGVTEETGFGLAEAFLTPSQRVDSDTMEVVCNACGFTASQLKKIGRMGCPECYSAFSEGLDGLLRNMHKGTRHIGKRPNRKAPTAPVQPRSRTIVQEAPAPAPPVPPSLDVSKLREDLDKLPQS